MGAGAGAPAAAAAASPEIEAEGWAGAEAEAAQQGGQHSRQSSWEEHGVCPAPRDRPEPGRESAGSLVVPLLAAHRRALGKSRSAPTSPRGELR